MIPHLSCLSIAERSGSGLEISNLTRDEVVATLETVDNTLSCLCGCTITKAGEGKPLPFESAMAELLLVGWAKASRGAVEVAMKGLAARAGEITNREIKGILTGIEMQIEAKFVKPTGNGLPKLITGAYKKAKGDVMRKHKRRLMMAAFDDDAMQWLNDHHMYWVGSYYDRFLSEQIAKTIKDGMVEGLGREAIGGKLKSFFDKYPGVQSKPDVYWRGMAANGMNRSRNFGLISGYQDVGVKQLRVLAVIDSRTSPICREMNGKIIPVARAADQRDAMMAAESPEDIKTISPWLAVKDIAGLSTAKIMDKGMIMPPFHFNCRSTVVEE